MLVIPQSSSQRPHHRRASTHHRERTGRRHCNYPRSDLPVTSYCPEPAAACRQMGKRQEGGCLLTRMRGRSMIS